MALNKRIKDAGGALPLGLLGLDVADVKAVQTRLTQIGLLDPPSDGVFGPVSLWALSAFCKAANLPFNGNLTEDIWKRLNDGASDSLFPLAPDDSFAGRALSAMQQQGYWIARHPDCVNIIYVEGSDLQGRPNGNAPNRFNDVRLVVSIGADGKPVVQGLWEGTTEPGRRWTMNPMSPLGAARIAFNQYKAWSVGVHHAGSASAHEALVQTAPIKVHRDKNQDFKRDNDKTETGLFAINQHWGYDMPVGDLGDSSAGCLVGRTRTGHRTFMAIVKSDARHETNHAYRFMTTVMPLDQLPAG